MRIMNSTARFLPRSMARRLLTCVGACVALAGAPSLPAATILQASGSSSVAFEAEDNVVLTPGTPTSFVITNDATPSGNRALYAAGANNTGFPASFASYNIRFATAGTYKLYFRWRANELYTDADPNSGNSFYAPNKVNASTSPLNPNPDYTASTVNNTRVRPESNTYHVDPENGSLVTISQAAVDAGVPLVFSLGTREAGFMFDRFVLSQDTTLTEAQFNATPNAETTVFEQPSGVNYVAFEAESPKGTLTGGTVNSWVITNDVTPSGTTALYAAGANNTGFPASFATYSIKFGTPGVYKMFFRWRANELYTDADPNSGNSFYAPNKVNANTNAINPNPDYTASTVNNTRVRPESNTYHVDSENGSLITVSQAQVDAGAALDFSIGTREAGFMFDRIVLTTDSTLTESQFNALENTGAVVPPQITAAVGSASLTTVRITFSKALDEVSVQPGGFRVSGGVTTLNAALDPVTLKDVLLTTTPQTEGVEYTVAVSDVNDLGGNFIAPNTTTRFFAWQLARGFARRDFYFAVTGTDVASLLAAPAFPNNPNRSDVVSGLASINDPRAQNYGVRLTGFFIPDKSGIYSFFMYNNDEAQLSLSTDATPENLQVLLTAPPTATMAFSPAVTAQSLSLAAGARYAIQVLLKQGNEFDAFVNVAAQHETDATPVDQLPPLGPSLLGTMVNPSTARLVISRQPAAATITAGRRVRLETAAASPAGPVFYQWQANGTDIPGATRAAYYTPVLAVVDSGTQYRCLIRGGGTSATTTAAAVTVNPGLAASSQPFLGINFAGGDAAGAAGSLRPVDVTGVVPQANFNNIAGGTVTDAPLNDAVGAPTGVTISYAVRTYFTGSGENTAEDVLFQGYLHNANNPVSVLLKNVPAGSYDLYAYCVGFNYNATYEQAMNVTGAQPSVEYHVRTEHAGDYASASGLFRAMASTAPAARQKGNYVAFRNVSPDASGNLIVNVINESDNPLDVDVTPALSGLQLVQVPPALSVTSVGGGAYDLSWGQAAAGYTLESTASLGGSTPANWQPAAGAPAPLTGAGTVPVPSSGIRFFRLRK